MGCKAETEIGQDLLNYRESLPGTEAHNAARKQALARLADGEVLDFKTTGTGCGFCGGSSVREYRATRTGDDLIIVEL